MKRLLFILLILTGADASAQTYHQALYWLRYQAQFSFSPSLYWNNEIDNRRFFNPDVENQLIMHSRLHYKVSSWDLAVGLTYSIAYAAIPENGYKNTVHELRPVVEASYEIPVGKVFLTQRLRMDNRIFQEEPDQSLFEESFYVMRFRYRIQGRVTLKKNQDNVSTISLRVSDEIMVNTTENFFDQNRAYVTTEFYLNKRFSFLPEYIYIFQQRYGTDEFFSRNVIRLTLSHKFSP